MAQRTINWTGMAFGLALAVLAAYQQLKLPPVLPILLQDYRFSHVLAGGFMSIYALCGLLLSLRLGDAMQRHGTTPFLYLAFALFVAAALVMVRWPDLGWLFLLARALEGVAFAMLAIAGPAICTAHAGTRGLPIASAIAATWIPLGGLLANGLAAQFVESAGWRFLWWAGIVCTVAMTVWTAARRKDATPARAAARDAPAAVAAPGSAAQRQRTMIFAALLFTLWSVQFFGYITWLPHFLVDVHGYSPRMAATLFMIPIAILVLFNLIAASILRTGFPVALLLAATNVVQAAVWLLVPMIEGPAAGAAALAIYAMAAGISPTCLFAMPGTIFGIEGAGTRAFGVLMTGRNLGVLAGPVLTGALVAAQGWNAATLTLGSVTVVMTFGALLLHRRLKSLPH